MQSQSVMVLPERCPSSGWGEGHADAGHGTCGWVTVSRKLPLMWGEGCGRLQERATPPDAPYCLCARTRLTQSGTQGQQLLPYPQLGPFLVLGQTYREFLPLHRARVSMSSRVEFSWQLLGCRQQVKRVSPLRAPFPLGPRVCLLPSPTGPQVFLVVSRLPIYVGYRAPNLSIALDFPPSFPASAQTHHKEWPNYPESLLEEGFEGRECAEKKRLRF